MIPEAALYPHHSSRVSARVTPPPTVLRELVPDPIGELDADFLLAFGYPWFDVAERINIAVGREFKADWATHEGVSGQDLIDIAQSGYVGPPGAQDTDELAKALSIRCNFGTRKSGAAHF